MKIGFIKSLDQRTPITIESAKKLQKAGNELMIDDKFEDILDDQSLTFYPASDVLSNSDILISIDPLSEEEYHLLKPKSQLISIYEPYIPGFQMNTYGRTDIQIYSLDMIPRSTLAQSMDILSSMASISGYKAVLLASFKLSRFLPMMMTAAGTIRPANVLIIGAGVAGLQAIATARKLGAKVEAFDVRSAVKEEVQSLGAKFVEVEGATDDKAAGGYAVQQSEDFLKKQKEAIAQSVAKSDIVITTAQLRGRKAPILVTKDMIAKMKRGSVVIDMASSTGGNVEGSVDLQETLVNGVVIIGNSKLYLDCLSNASDLLSNNIANFLLMFKESEESGIDASHEILTSSKIFPTS